MEDEFLFIPEIQAELGLDGPIPRVRRVDAAVDGLRHLSALQWGPDATFTLLHGIGQNAHTFDPLLVALGAPALAIDLPGHGHSDTRVDGSTEQMAADVITFLDALRAQPRVLIGMSLGGLVSIDVATALQDRLVHLVLIDITPDVAEERASSIFSFLDGPDHFASRDEMIERTAAFYPQRSVASLRRGVTHNSHRRADGTWSWRHQRPGQPPISRPASEILWGKLEALKVPVTLVRGTSEGSVVRDQDAARWAALPGGRVIEVPGAGHAVQSDQPVRLAQILRDLDPS